MEEDKVKQSFSGLTPESSEILDNIFSNNNDDDISTSGLKMLSVLLSLNDEDFELIRPVIQDALIDAYNDPQVQMQLVQTLNASGISINDLLNYNDEVFDKLFETEDLQLTESKKDFLKFMFSGIANSISTSTINPAHVVEIPIELCRENAKLPTYATNGSAAMDIYAPEEITLDPGECKVIPVGFKVSIPHGYALLIQPRSGLSRRIKLRIPNSPGLIDEDYHEEIGVIVENIDQQVKDVDIDPVSDHTDLVKLYGRSITIGKGERFAQMRLIEVPRVKWRQVNSIGTFNLDEDHGAGFGSSGTN